jgi:hypothetical protein
MMRRRTEIEVDVTRHIYRGWQLIPVVTAIASALLFMLVAPTNARAQQWNKVLVAATGDSIGGKTIGHLAFPSLNDNGAVAFFVMFSEGGSGVAVWDGNGLGLDAFGECPQCTSEAR